MLEVINKPTKKRAERVKYLLNLMLRKYQKITYSMLLKLWETKQGKVKNAEY